MLTVAELRYVFSVDTRGLSRGLSMADRGMRSLMGLALKVAPALGAAFGVAEMVRFGRESVRMATEFQSSMMKVHTQAGGSVKDVQTLSRQVLKLALYAEQGPKELADSLYHLKSVGMDNVDAMKALRTASDLAAVGGADLESTTNALAGAWRTGIKGAQSFSEAAATVNAIIGAGNMRMEDFTAAISTGILPVAKTFGLTLKQVGAALALFTDEGVPAQVAAHRLRMSIALLAAPSSVAEKWLAKIGLTGVKLGRALREHGLIGAIQMLKDHLDKSGLSTEKQHQLLVRAFGGGQSSSAILGMVNNLDVLKQKQDQVNRSTGRYGESVRAQRKTAEAQFALLKSSWDVLKVKLGASLLPSVVRFVRFLGNKAIPAVMDFAHTASREFKRISASPIGQDIEGFFRGLTTTSEQQYAKAKTKFGVKPLPVGYNFIPTTKAERAGAAVRNMLSGLSGTFQDAIKHADWAGAGSALGSALLDNISFGGASQKTLGERLGHWLSHVNWAHVAGSVLKTNINFIVVEVLKGWGESIGDRLWGWISDGFAKNGREGGMRLFRVIAGLLYNPLLLVAPFIEGVLTSMFEDFGHWIAGRFEDFGHWIAAGFKRGWMAGLSRLLGVLYNPFYLIIDEVKKIFGIGSPSRVFAAIGRDVIRGFVNGLLDMAGRPVATLRRMARSAQRVFANAGRWLVGEGHDLLDGFGSGILGGWRPVGRWLGRSRTRILGYFIGAPGWLVRRGRDVIVGFDRGLLAQWRPTNAWIKNTKNRVLQWFAHAGTWIYVKGKDVLLGFYHGLQQPWDSIKKFVSNIAKTIKGLKGPLAADRKLLVPEGKALMSGLLEGIKSGAGALFGHVSGISGTIGEMIAKVAAQFGWTGAQVGAIKWIVSHESGGRPTAQNPTSSAYGLFQFLNSTWATVGGHKTSNALLQILYGLRYIARAYGNPINAMRFWQRHHWYARGTRSAMPGWAVVGEEGPELVKLRGGEQIRSHRESMARAGDGAEQRMILELRSSGRKVDDMLLELLRGAIRIRGGNVQVVLGRH